MNEFTNNLQHHIDRAITKYITLCSGIANVSNRRKTTIQNIKRIIAQPSYNIFSTIDQIKNVLKKMKTGWLFFDFGRSRLKNLVEEEIKKFKKIHIDACYIKLPSHVQSSIQIVNPKPNLQYTQSSFQQKNKKENFSVAACKNFLQFKPKAKVQTSSKPMLKLDTDISLKNVDFLM